jgi:transcriptional regulator GlxA family with amidase domain
MHGRNCHPSRIDATSGALDDASMRHRTVVIVVFDGVQGLDAFGPADVFYFANYLAEQAGEPVLPYGIEFAAMAPGPVVTAAGPRIFADRSLADPELEPDVLLVAGGLAVPAAARDEAFIAHLRAVAGRSEEVGSVCTGALLLAQAGLLDGHRATTHWALADMLTASFPQIDVDADHLYVHDGVWSSAGVTAGIDLALQLVQTHHGRSMAAEAARNMVVYLQRAGGQQQYSAHLAAQQSPHPTIADLMAHIADHPDQDLSVEALAEYVSMSERSFQRLFTREVGLSPGKYVERTRIDAARRLLEQTDDGLEHIAARCGFATVETFHRSFKRIVGVTPNAYRQRFPMATIRA